MHIATVEKLKLKANTSVKLSEEKVFQSFLFKKVNRVKSRYIFYIYDRGCSHNSMSLQPHFFGTDIEAFFNQLDDEDFWEFLRMERFPWIMRTWSLEDLRRYAILYRDRVVLTSEPPTSMERRRCFFPSDTAQFGTCFEGFDYADFWFFIRSSFFSLEISTWSLGNLRCFFDKFRDRIMYEIWVNEISDSKGDANKV